MIAGWWTATTDSDLLDLLQAADESGRHIWSPYGVSVRSHATLIGLVRAFRECERSKAMESSPPSDETPPTPCAPQKRVTHPSRGHFLFGDAPGMLRVPSAEEWDLLREELLVEGRAAVRVVDALPTSAEGNQSRCEKCGCYAFDQFDDAACPVCRTAL